MFVRRSSFVVRRSHCWSCQPTTNEQRRTTNVFLLLIFYIHEFRIDHVVLRLFAAGRLAVAGGTARALLRTALALRAAGRGRRGLVHRLGEFVARGFELRSRLVDLVDP